MAKGLLVTIEITVLALIIALIIGLFIGLMNTARTKILRSIGTVYIDIIRGTPLLVQIFIIYFGIPYALDFQIDEFVAGIAAISLNASAYLAEIFRAGIQSVDGGQMEAARSLGLTRGQAMRLVVLPQAVRRMIPAFVNQAIVSMKDTSLLTVIGIRELTNSGEIIISGNYRFFEIWITVAVFYFVFIHLLTLFSRYLEKRLAN
nr:amino acid ABC transporter permease [Brevibacillus fulvus]